MISVESGSSRLMHIILISPKSPISSVPYSDLPVLGNVAKEEKAVYVLTNGQTVRAMCLASETATPSLWENDWGSVQKALDAFIPGQVVDIDTDCYAGENSK
jgi:hypothetical protein